MYTRIARDALKMVYPGRRIMLFHYGEKELKRNKIVLRRDRGLPETSAHNFWGKRNKTHGEDSFFNIMN